MKFGGFVGKIWMQNTKLYMIGVEMKTQSLGTIIILSSKAKLN